jgi:hypothetical protein
LHAKASSLKIDKQTIKKIPEDDYLLVCDTVASDGYLPTFLEELAASFFRLYQTIRRHIPEDSNLHSHSRV